MAYDVAQIACVFFLASACAVLRVSLRYTNRSATVNKFAQKPGRQERARRLVHRWLQGFRVLEIDPTAADDRIDRWR